MESVKNNIMLKIIVCFTLLITDHGLSAQSDSIVVDNIVEFCKYTEPGNVEQDAVKFILQVTNNSNHPIPDLGATARSEYVTFLINGKVHNPLSLFNGTELANGVKTIPVDSTQRFRWLLTPDEGLVSKYGKEFTVQWEYLNIKSDIVKINLDTKTIKKLDEN
jgi:hypothetical protein